MATPLANVIVPPRVVETHNRLATRSVNANARLIDPLSDSRWDTLAASHSAYTPFHSAAWAQVLCETYGHTPFYLHLAQGDNLLALVPLLEVNSPFTGRRAVCLPFTDFCGPLIYRDEVSTLIENELSKLARERQWKYIEVRGETRCEGAEVSNPTFYGHELDLRPGVDQLFAGFHSSVRRAIRKAEHSDLAIRISGTRESVVEFYRLHLQTRQRHGTPPQPISFFLKIHDAVIQQGLGFVVQATLGSRPVAAAVFFNAGKSAVYKFGASEERCNELRGNNLVMWEAIKELVSRGAERLHFGRTAPDNEGLRRYKSTWGAREESILYSRFDVDAQTWKAMDGCTSPSRERFFRQMPLALNRLAGAMLYPHLH